MIYHVKFPFPPPPPPPENKYVEGNIQSATGMTCHDLFSRTSLLVAGYQTSNQQLYEAII